MSLERKTVCWAFWVQAGQLPDLSLHRHSDFLGWQVRLVRHNLQFSFLWINQSFQSLHYLYGQFFLPSLSWILFLLRRLHELCWSFGGRLWSMCFFLQPKETETNRKPKPRGSFVQVAGGGAGSETCSCDIWMDRTNPKKIGSGVSTVTMRSHAIRIQERLASESNYIHRTYFGLWVHL